MESHIASGCCVDGSRYTSVTYGPLLFALPIPVLDNDLNTPDTTVPFQYALRPDAAIQVSHHPMPARWSWDKAPLQLTVKGEPAVFGPDFALPKQVISASPDSPAKNLKLRPFGSTAFRISMFALAEPRRKRNRAFLIAVFTKIWERVRCRPNHSGDDPCTQGDQPHRCGAA